MYRPSSNLSEMENYNTDQSFYVPDGQKHATLLSNSESQELSDEILRTLIDLQNDPFNGYFNNTSTPPPEEIDNFCDNDNQGNYAEDILFPPPAYIRDCTEELFQNFDVFPGGSSSSISPRGLNSLESNTTHAHSSLGAQFSELCSLASPSYDASQNISNSIFHQDFLLRSDQDLHDIYDLNYPPFSTSSSQFCQISESELLQSSMSCCTPDLNTTFDSSDYEGDASGAISLSQGHLSTPSPSPSCASGKKRISLDNLSNEEKYKRIRDQNNEASRLYRQRKKNMKSQISEECTELSKKNAHLKQCVKFLQTRVDKYKELKNTIEKSGYSFPVNNYRMSS